MNWRSPLKTLTELIRISKCEIIFASDQYRDAANEVASATGVRVIFITDLDLLKPVAGFQDTGCGCTPTDVAVVFFTSGSTSLPKAVPHTHRSLMWLAHKYNSAFPEPYQTTDPNAATLCFFPYFHVMGFR
jgi:long-subunit acyl-CoA synthetase (AMP-forming)